MAKSKSKQNIVPWMARQGDVLIIEAAIPSGVVEVAPERGKAIVAHGEATGHHHAFARTAATIYRDESDARYVRVAGTARQGDRERAATINAEIRKIFAHREVDVDVRKAEVELAVTVAESEGFVALRHLGDGGTQADHLPIVYPPGFEGQIALPSEYTPAEIVPVAD